MNLMNLYQDKLHDIQEFRDQYMAIWKVSNKLGLRFCMCQWGCEGSTEGKRDYWPIKCQSKKAIDKIKEEHHVLCSIQDKLAILKSWILLDSQSTVDVFCNRKPLSNIRYAKRTLILYCNTRKAIVSKKGDLKGYGTVWYHPEGITTILSLHNVQKT